MGLVFVRQGVERIVAALEVERIEFVVKDAKLTLDSRVIIGEAIQMGQDGSRRKRIFERFVLRNHFEPIQAKKPQVLNRNPIHDHFFLFGDGLILEQKSATDLQIDLTITVVERTQED